jgi:patatin-like phospholipase/acyl hydrolase
MFRILAIDGGGVRGIFPAHVLALFSRKHGTDLTSVFDLIVGTSTGAIIAAAAAVGIPLEKVSALYEQRAGEIFTRQRCSVHGLLRSRYRSEPLRRVLTDVFGDATMGDVPGRLILPSTDLSNGNVFVIKSQYLESFVRDAQIPLVEAIMASCAAPTYFDPVRLNEYLLGDGGLWSNNPSFVAYTEAIGKLAIPPDEVRILSVGTGTGHQFYDVGKAAGRTWGLATGWCGSRLIDTILNLQSRASANAAMLLLQDKYLRISFEESGALPLDDIAQIPRLKAKAGEAFTYKSDAIKKFLEL